MEKKKRLSCLIIAIICALLILSGAAYATARYLGDKKISANSPPTVQITNPAAGETFSADSMTLVSTSAFGNSAIRTLELWLDGQKVDQEGNTESAEGIFKSQFEVNLTEGGHMLVARAIDQDGLVGQSLPIPVYGSKELADEAGLIYTAGEGDTVENIADQFGVEAGDVAGMNPGLGGGELAAGTQVNLPVGKEQDPQEAQPPADVIQPEPVDTTGAIRLTAVIPANPLASLWDALTQFSPPVAPTGLGSLVVTSDCSMNLYWLDRSDDEDYFRIWMAGLGVPPRVIATVSSGRHQGPVWYQFDIPPAGMYSFWVEAVNAIGAQPSETVWAGVPATQCSNLTAAYLQLEVKEITFFGFYDRLYSYLSVEGAPEKRFPAHDGEFWVGALNISQTTLYPFEKNITIIPLPEDGVLDLEGKCMGWMGQNLVDLGSFRHPVSSSQWDGSDQVIESPNFRLVFSIQPMGALEARGTYTFSDMTLQRPFNLKDSDTGKRGNPYLPTDHELSWEWTDDEREITGFTVFLNGNPVKVVQPHERQATYTPPSFCGEAYHLIVAVNTAHGQSENSKLLIAEHNPCPIMAEIQFISITTGQTNDSLRGKCDTLETYFKLWGSGAAEEKRALWGKPFFFPMTCGKTYTFDDIAYGIYKKRGLDRIVVPIDPDNPQLVFGVFGWDYDWGSSDDALVMAKQKIEKAITYWPVYEEEFVFNQMLSSGIAQTTVRVKGLIGGQ